MEWFTEALRKYAVFSGRSRRKEYWYFVLFTLLISIALNIIDVLTGTYDIGAGVGLLGGIFGLAILIPSIADRPLRADAGAGLVRAELPQLRIRDPHG